MDERLHLHPVGRSRPLRTCIGCRQRDRQSDLLRVVARGTEAVPDGSARQPGRGAYVHPRPECLELAQRRRAFARSLRVVGQLSVDAVRESVQRQQQPSEARENEMSAR